MGTRSAPREAGDRAYHHARAEQERASAELATSDVVRAIHTERPCAIRQRANP